MFYHIEYRDMPSGALGLEPVVVIDPMGIMAIIIIILVIIAFALYLKLEAQKETIAEQQDLIESNHNEDRSK